MSLCVLPIRASTLRRFFIFYLIFNYFYLTLFVLDEKIRVSYCNVDWTAHKIDRKSKLVLLYICWWEPRHLEKQKPEGSCQGVVLKMITNLWQNRWAHLGKCIDIGSRSQDNSVRYHALWQPCCFQFRLARTYQTHQSGLPSYSSEG